MSIEKTENGDYVIAWLEEAQEITNPNQVIDDLFDHINSGKRKT